MSIEASSFVLGLSMGRGNGIRKLILLGYANHADKHGRGAYPSIRTIADYAECDPRTVQRHIRWLLTNGYLREGDQRTVDHLDPRYRPIVYDVAMTADQITEWAADADHPNSHRSRSAAVGGSDRGASAQATRGDNLSPLPEVDSPQASRGDTLPPLPEAPRGDNGTGSGVTNHAPRGDTGVTRTVIEPPQEPSSSTPAMERRPAAAHTAAGGGGQAHQPPIDAFDVLPHAIHDHPSVIPGAITRRVRPLLEHGWSRDQIRGRLVGVETADHPGAAALARLAYLDQLRPPTAPTPRPPWCGGCDPRTRMREDPNYDDRPFPCPDCHPRGERAVTDPSTTGPCATEA